MHRRHFETLAAIYRVPPAMRWADIESLLKAVGEVKEREGSRIVAMANGVSAVFHRPHPSPQARRFLIRDVRSFLTRAGIRPEHG
jgi:hypothetical protein